MRKIVTTLFALVLTLAMSVTAFATGGDNGNDKVIVIDNAKTGHTYEAYQIFTGNLDGSTLSNIVWGSNVDTSKLSTAGLNTVAKTVAGEMNVGNADAYAQKFGKVLTGSPAATATAPTDGKYSLTGLTQGYYLIKDRDNSVTGHDAYTLFICQITTSDVEVAPKSDVPSVEKKVEDINDSTTASTKADLSATWNDSADYDIGDAVPFRLTATLPTDVNGHGFADYDSYKLVFTDTLSSGLTAPTNNLSNFDIYFGTHKLTAEELTTVGAGVNVNGQNITVTLNDVKALTGNDKAVAGGSVSVIYKATLNADAATGTAGNPNSVKLAYSNNPNEGGSASLGETPSDVVKVFTYKLKIVKTNENSQALTGAVFKLQKKDGTGAYVDVSAPVVIENGAGDGQNEFTVKGLDDGDYRIVEVTAPTGYSKIEDIEFTAAATHTDGADPTLETLTATITNASSVISGSATLSADKAEGLISGTVQDEKGIVLPGTGGVGTYILYGLGAVIIIAAGMGLCRKNRQDEK